MWVLGTESRSLLDQQVLLITESSLQPLPTPKESVEENIEKFHELNGGKTKVEN